VTRATAVLALMAIAGGFMISGCGKKDDGVVRRAGEPDFVRAFDEERMDAAMAEARSSLGVFVSALEAKDPASEGFAIKKGFDYGSGEKEFVWINEVEPAGVDFEGRINNRPVNDIGVQLGQKVRVKSGEVADWMFMSGGKLQGGYTIVALVHGTGEQAQYEQSMGIDWSRYKFLTEKIPGAGKRAE
jgi:uncharacterized protein YegJ (DUF2314 family)